MPLLTSISSAVASPLSLSWANVTGIASQLAREYPVIASHNGLAVRALLGTCHCQNAARAPHSAVASRDSLSVTATNEDEAFAVAPDGHGLRVTVADAQLPLAGIEEVDLVAGGGEDSVAIGDLAKTGAQLVDVSLASVPITPLGDFNADRISVAGRGALKLAGKVVSSGTATLTGLPWTVNVSHAESFDTLAISGAKSVDTSGLVPGTIGVELSAP